MLPQIFGIIAQQVTVDAVRVEALLTVSDHYPLRDEASQRAFLRLIEGLDAQGAREALLHPFAAARPLTPAAREQAAKIL